MSEQNLEIPMDQDPNASDRKHDHIQLAFKARVREEDLESRFYYEPILSGHPQCDSVLQIDFLSSKFKLPLWVSSMTGGTQKASMINKNLAKACGQFGMGMGLGSCRQLLYSDEYLKDFQVRNLMNDQPLYANLGIAQVEQLIKQKKTGLINELINKLDANGLIVHINPMQEWLQPEGDRYYTSPLQTITELHSLVDTKIIVKEVGQGMGRESLRALLKLPIEAIDFAANGGTNFALLELLRADKEKLQNFELLANIGHSAGEMVDMTNLLIEELGSERKCNQIIVSGGITNFLDGYYLIQKLKIPAIYGQASEFLKYAMDDYSVLEDYIYRQIEGLKIAYTFLKIK